MRILWLNHRDPFHPMAGGAEKRFEEIARRLAARGHEVVLLAEKPPGLSRVEELAPGVRVVRTGGRLGVHLWALGYVLRYAGRFDVIVDDVAHAVPWFSPLASLGRAPVVAQVHHVHQDVVGYELSWPLAALVRAAEKAMGIVYERFIAVSESTRRELTEKLGVDPEKITVVPNGVDTSRYRPGVKSSTPLVIWVGRLKRYKRVDHVVKAFSIVSREVRDARLYIVGRGDFEAEARRLVEKLGLSGRVVFTGFVGEDEKIRFMQQAWVNVSASVKEGWGLTVLEAAACATPTVAYRVPGLVDSVRHMETGILVEPGRVEALAEALTLLLADEGLREKLSMGALRFARSLDWDRVAEAMEKVLVEVARA